MQFSSLSRFSLLAHLSRKFINLIRMLDFIALLILLVLATLIGSLVWYLGTLPGRVAKNRNHPYELAISYGGWATLVLGGVGWPFVLMWAYAPNRLVESSRQETELRDEIRLLQAQMNGLSQQLQAQEGQKS
jgi:hypothetical protein